MTHVNIKTWVECNELHCSLIVSVEHDRIKQQSMNLIELDDGKIYRKALYLMVKTHGFPVDFPLIQ